MNKATQDLILAAKYAESVLRELGNEVDEQGLNSLPIWFQKHLKSISQSKILLQMMLERFGIEPEIKKWFES